MSKLAFVPDCRRLVLEMFSSGLLSLPLSTRNSLRGLGAIPPAIAHKESEIVVTKHRVSAFAGTDLAMILRANDIDTLVLLGIATSGVVLSTLVEAADADFRLAVIKDCCADLDSSLHDCLINNFFPSRAAVLSAREFVEPPGSSGGF